VVTLVGDNPLDLFGGACQHTVLGRSRRWWWAWKCSEGKLTL